MLVDATAVPSPSVVLLGLEGFVVLAVAEAGGEIEMLIETDADLVGCPQCGAVAIAHGRRRHCVRDLPVGGRAVVLTWCKRIWRCEQPACPVRTWSERHPAIRPRSVLSERAAWWATEQVGRRRRTVAAVARELGGAAWRTVMRAVRRHGQPLVDDPGRLAGVRRLGVDEHAFLRATATRATQFATGVIDTTSGRPARLLDVLPGRTGSALSAWLTSQQRTFREQITIASLDPFRGYATALTRCLPQATRVVDGFHITRLGGQTLTEVRCRVQQQTLGHRGRTGDPLFGIRRVLLRRADRLSARARTRLEDGLRRGDPDGEVWAAWLVYQHLLAVYAAPDAATGRARLASIIDEATSCPVPELTRLGRTLHEWRTDITAYFSTDRTSNGPTEAVNLIIETTRRAAHGFRNFANYRLRLLLSHGVTWQDPPQLRIRTRSPRLST